MSDPVLFYGHTDGEHKCFSNFYPCEFEWLGLTWACSEQAYMYCKSDDKVYRRQVLNTSNPYQVKKLGRKVVLRPRWDEKKFNFMVEILKAKFSQNPELREVLLSTGDRAIHEDCRDPWWGGGPNWPNGRDLLGCALMQVRKWLREQS